MGMYRGLRVKVYVKEEYREFINEILDYEEWADFQSQYPFLKRFVALHRAHMIPRGVLTGMPNQWDDTFLEFHSDIDMDTGYWAFQCSINYGEEEIDVFLQDVLSEIIYQADYIEKKFEELEDGELYTFVNGKIVPSAQRVLYK